MAETMAQHGATAPAEDGETRRDFLKLVAASFAAVGVGRHRLALHLLDEPGARRARAVHHRGGPEAYRGGSAVTVVWRGKPVFVRNRTPEEIKSARDTPLSELPDPASDQSRIKRDPWLVVVGICTHLGCVPLGQKPTDPRGDYGGWFCPCHGSHYDTSGRIRKGPGPANLAVPDYAFTSDTQIRIG